MQQDCRICGAKEWSILYKGPIRMGKFGNWSKSTCVIWKCGRCQAGFLYRPVINYETLDYWNMVEEKASPEHLCTLYGAQQIDRLKILGKDNLRGKVLADIGCSVGSFLDLVKEYTLRTIGVEPCRSFHQELKNKGHRVYSSCQNALQDWKGSVDVAVSFAVLEHVEDPLTFLKEIKMLLKPNGLLLISTPNYNDWLIELLPEVYGRFFFRYVHTWYFNQESLRTIGTLAGFKKTEIQHMQRFDISNALLWARDGRPTGLGKIKVLQGLDSLYKQLLETSGSSDFIYAWLYK